MVTLQPFVKAMRYLLSQTDKFNDNFITVH